MSSGDDFQFDDFNVSPTDLEQSDKNFIQSIQERTADMETSEDDCSFNFWFLIVLLVIFVFVLSSAVIFIARGRQRRREYQKLGYRE